MCRGQSWRLLRKEGSSEMRAADWSLSKSLAKNETRGRGRRKLDACALGFGLSLYSAALLALFLYSVQQVL